MQSTVQALTIGQWAIRTSWGEDIVTNQSDEPDRGVARFQIVREINGRYYWRLINPSGTPEARSTADYATEDEAVIAAEHAKRLISHAPVTRS